MTSHLHSRVNRTRRSISMQLKPGNTSVYGNEASLIPPAAHNSDLSQTALN
jgi:hypothetical protein